MLLRCPSLLLLGSSLSAASGFLASPRLLQQSSSAKASPCAVGRLSASTIAGDVSSFGRDKAEGDSDSSPLVGDDQISEVQGEHYPWYSHKPLQEGLQWASAPGQYFKEKKELHNSEPIFKMHPGLASVAITDHGSGKWFFDQPDTVLDRQDGAYFGAMQCRSDYVGESLPALVTNLKEAHPAVRDYMLTIVRDRLSCSETALSHASDKFYEKLRTNGLGEYTGVYDTFLQQSYSFVLEFLFGTGEEGGQPLPPFKDFLNVNPLNVHVLIKLKFDTPVADFFGQRLQDLSGGVTDEEKASIEVLLDSIRSSKMWPKFAKILEERQVPTKQLERSLMFNTGFQSSVAIARNMEYAIGALSANPDFVKELQKELDGKELTIKSVCDVEKFPLLDSFHWEILRMFPAPPFYVKKAKEDVVVPTSSGKKYRIKKGETLVCHQDLVQIDEAVFGPDARIFKPKRFLGNPELQKKVFKFGYQDAANPVQKDGMPWGCVAHAAGVLDGILKVFYGRWIQEMDWEMSAPPVIDPDLFLGTVGPAGMSFSKITPRK